MSICSQSDRVIKINTPHEEKNIGQGLEKETETGTMSLQDKTASVKVLKD